MSGHIAEQDFTVRYQDTDLDKKLSPVALLDYFLDMAIYQSEQFGVGIDYLAVKNVAWFLYKWNVKINRMPSLYEHVVVRTQPYSLRKFYAFRKFWMANEAGEILATSDSMWLYIDLEKRRPQRPSNDIHTKYGVPEGFDEALEFETIEPPARTDFEKSLEIRLTDTDTNHHVNSASYVEWALETLPPEFLAGKQARSMSIVYEKETHYGKTVKIAGEKLAEKSGESVLFEISDDENPRLAGVKISFGI